MKSKTINSWEKVEKNPPESYQDFFEKERIFLEERIVNSKLLLDLGCGGGRMFDLFSRMSKEVLGIDNDFVAVEKAKEKAEQFDNVEVRKMDAEHLVFDNESFDIVAIIGTFSNFGETKDNVLREVHRVLKSKTGTLFLTVYNKFALPERLKVYEQLDKIKKVDREKGKVFLENGIVSEQFSEEQIKEILDKTGFYLREIEKGPIYYLIEAGKK